MAVLQLLERLSDEQFVSILYISKAIGGAFYGNAIEWYIHKKASSPVGLSFEAWPGDSNSRKAVLDNSRKLVFLVPGKAAVCKGEKLKECRKGVNDWLIA